MLKKFIMAAVFAVGAPMMASAASVQVCEPPVAGASYEVGFGTVYNCDYTFAAATGSGSGSLNFFSNVIPHTVVAGTASLFVEIGSSMTSAAITWYESDAAGVLGAQIATSALTIVDGIAMVGKLSTTFEGPAPDYQAVEISWTGYTGKEIDLNFVVSRVPVPAAGLLLLTALGGMGLASRRRKTS